MRAYYLIVDFEHELFIAGTSGQVYLYISRSTGRHFKSIAEIRSFMPRFLKHPNHRDSFRAHVCNNWKIERHDIAEQYPVSAIFTSSHTMALLSR
jgi:hypothetical protein